MSQTAFARLSVLLLVGLFGLAPIAHAQTPVDQVAALVDRVNAALGSLATGALASAEAEYQQFETEWPGAADGVRTRSPSSYQAIADAMTGVSAVFAADQVDPLSAQAALLKLRDASRDFIALSRPGSQTLTLYSAQHDYVTSALVDAFQKQTGILVRVHAGDDFELANQLVAEGSASPADVFLTENSPPLQLLSDRSLLTGVTPVTLARVPAHFNSPSGDWIGVAARETVLIYNPQVVSESDLPRSLLDLGQPGWKGKLAIAPAEPDFQPVVSAVIRLHGAAAAESWLTGFKNNATLYNDNEGIVAAVEKGQVGAAIVNHYYWFRAAADAGGPGSMHSKVYYFGGGDAGALLDISGAGQLRSAPHPEQAQRFLDFLVSEQGQTTRVSSGDFEYPLVSGVGGSSLLRPFDQLQPPNLTAGELGDGRDALDLLQKVGLL